MATYRFEIHNFKKLLMLPIWLIVLPISILIPRKRNSWVFGKKHQEMGDGPGDFMRYVSAHSSEIKCVWLSQDKQIVKKVRNDGFNAEYIFSLKGLITAFRAGTTVIATGIGDVNRPAAIGSRIVQLWHGSPLKKIHLDSPIHNKLPVPFCALNAFLYFISKWSYRQWHIAVTACERTALRYNTAFGLPMDRILPIGDPRCDRLIGESNSDIETKREKLYDYWRLSPALSKSEKLILYAPTWRDGKDWIPGPPPTLTVIMKKSLASMNARFIIRSHPLDGSLFYQGDNPSDRLSFLPPGNFPHINEWLSAFDVLITDYSSIAMDWALLRKPLILFPFDLEQYRIDRGLYEPYDVFAGEKWCSTWEEIIEYLNALLLRGETKAFRVSDHLLRRYHTFCDGKSCTRLLEALIQN
ncbi:MAG: CDP-glycerol glycerophosphotransferase family protein [Desulfobacterales bacterium]